MRKEVVSTILDLCRQTDINSKSLDDETLKQNIRENERIDLDEDDEDKLDEFMLKLASKKKSLKPMTKIAIATPRLVTPTTVTLDTISKANCVTDFEAGEIVRSTKTPNWGSGKIINIGYYHTSDSVYQKCEIMFSSVGMKTLIAYDGLLVRTADQSVIPSPSTQI